jgi:hypothetical protein
MIGQYLSNNNEKRYSAILPKISDLNWPLVFLDLCAILMIMTLFFSGNGTTAYNLLLTANLFIENVEIQKG